MLINASIDIGAEIIFFFSLWKIIQFGSFEFISVKAFLFLKKKYIFSAPICLYYTYESIWYTKLKCSFSFVVPIIMKDKKKKNMLTFKLNLEICTLMFLILHQLWLLLFSPTCQHKALILMVRKIQIQPSVYNRNVCIFRYVQ